MTTLTATGASTQAMDKITLSSFMSINAALFGGIGLGVIVLLLLAVSIAFDESSWGKTTGALLASFDSFGLIGSDVKEGHSPVQQSRPLGGAFSLLSTIIMATLTTALVLSFEYDNVIDQQAIVLLSDEHRAQALSLPEFKGPKGQGVQVRVTASGNLGACMAPLSWSATESGWTFRSTPVCGSGSSSQLDFSCASCSFTPTSALDVMLHYSCQTLSIEAAAVGASGDVIAFALPLAETTASAGALVSSVSWSLEPLLAIVNSTIKDTLSTRGFTLAVIDYTVVKQMPAVEGTGLAVAPKAATVSLHITLPLSSFTVILSLAQRMSLLDLVSSLTSLLGIFAFAALLLRAFSALGRANCCAATKTRKTTALLSSTPPAVIDNSGLPTVAHGRAVTVVSSSAPYPIGKTDPASVEEGQTTAFRTLSASSPLFSAVETEKFFVIREGAEVWYESATSGQLVWELPIGAAAIERDDGGESGGAYGDSSEPHLEAAESAESAATPSASTVTRASPWIRVSEGIDTWFESVETGENSWVLPVGAVLVASADYSAQTDSFAVTRSATTTEAVPATGREAIALTEYDVTSTRRQGRRLIIQAGFNIKRLPAMNAGEQ